MSLIAGIYSLNSLVNIKSKQEEDFDRFFQCSSEFITKYKNKNLFFMKCDYNSYDEGGFIDSDESFVSSVVGEPILVDDSYETYSRYKDLEAISHDLMKNSFSKLLSCNGTFCCLFYNLINNKLSLFTDKLGARPIYYYKSDNFLYFSNTLKLLEFIDEIPKNICLKSLAEEYFYCYPLLDRTKYEDIFVLEGGNYLEVSGQNVTVSNYFELSNYSIIDDNLDTLNQRVYQAFNAAIASRSKMLNEVSAFLSGGLDSRCIVSLLNSLHKNVKLLNCSRSNEQDKLFAQHFADTIDVELYSSIRPLNQGVNAGENTANLLTFASDTWKLCSSYSEKPKLIFSGDGGGEVLGFLQIDEDLLARFKSDSTHEFINYFNRKIALPEKILQPKVLAELKKLAASGMEEALNKLKCKNKDKLLHLFLLKNDLRRHLHEYYDNIMDHQVELSLPFYDIRVINSIMFTSLPMNELVRHKFYCQWLNCFDKSVSTVPWQSYPGHINCSIKTEDCIYVLDQWSKNKTIKFDLQELFDVKYLYDVVKIDKKNNIFLKKNFLIAYLLNKFKLIDYNYLHKFVYNYVYNYIHK